MLLEFHDLLVWWSVSKLLKNFILKILALKIYSTSHLKYIIVESNWEKNVLY